MKDCPQLTMNLRYLNGALKQAKHGRCARHAML